MTKPPTTGSQTEDELLSQIESSYLKDASEAPSAEVDRQILNYARQQLESKPAAHKLTRRLGKRMLMPLALAASLFFVVFSINWLWQEPVYMPPGTSGNQEEKFDNGQSGKSDQLLSENKVSVDDKNIANSSTGLQAQQDWADKIIDLIRQGKMEVAAAELERFKLTYPDYPIEQRIANLQR